MTLSLFVKDPGSALTHFIGMIMAAIAALPLLAVMQPAPFIIPLISLKR